MKMLREKKSVNPWLLQTRATDSEEDIVIATVVAILDPVEVVTFLLVEILESGAVPEEGVSLVAIDLLYQLGGTSEITLEVTEMPPLTALSAVSVEVEIVPATVTVVPLRGLHLHLL